MVFRKYSKKDMIADLIPPTNVAKDEATAFNVGLLQFRAASNSKLPALWYYTHINYESINYLFIMFQSHRHIVDKIGHKYEYIWYIDSDASVSPLFSNISIEEKIASWETETSINEIRKKSLNTSSFSAQNGQLDRKGGVAYGSKEVSKSAFIFFNNHPWRDGTIEFIHCNFIFRLHFIAILLG